ncbi:hypothetical protein ZEAMMB73_Zm00001d042689 [Zea mays]|uniref:Uncharacterized protein n=1 Tax=Zea mays TaxID=4577 RepID=A0A1D6N637_MAIZE|nr:hypothetical protein ZEAMMB73_Zm00001d042689 [Zea mays]
MQGHKNIVLATTPNGGHLAFFQDNWRRLWWVGATSEFLSALHDSSYMHRQKANDHVLLSSLDPPLIRVRMLILMEDGMVAAVTKDGPSNDGSPLNHAADEQLSNEAGGGQQNVVSALNHMKLHWSGKRQPCEPVNSKVMTSTA